MMMASPLAMCAIWGPGQTLLYNLPYAAFLGKRHPDALGQPLAQVWSEIWDDIGPLVDRVLGGESVKFSDMPLLMTRNGYDEDTWWSFAYSPLFDNGQVAGLLNIATETTAGVIAARERDAAEIELRTRNIALEGEIVARDARQVGRQWRRRVGQAVRQPYNRQQQDRQPERAVQVEQHFTVAQRHHHGRANEQHGQDRHGHRPVQHASQQIEVAWAIEWSVHRALAFWALPWLISRSRRLNDSE